MKKSIFICKTRAQEQKPEPKKKESKKISSKYLQKYDDIMKKVQMPKPYEYYIEKLIENQIYVDQKSVSQGIQVFIIDKTPSGSVIKLRVCIGFFTLQLNVINLQNCSQLHNHQPINSGGFGKVYLVEFRKLQGAVKCLKLRKESINWGNNWEVKFLMALKQYCFYKIFSALQIGPKLTKMFGFDIICFNDCIEFSLQICKKLKEANNKKLCSNYLKLLKVMHTFQIVHRDIKPDNIMFSQFYQKQVFIDFGTTTFLHEQIGIVSECTGIFGTPKYMGPQMENIWISNLKRQKSSSNYEGDLLLIDYYYNDLFGLLLTINTSTFQQDLQSQVHFTKLQIQLFTTNVLAYLIFCIENSKVNEVKNYNTLVRNFSKELKEYLCDCFFIQHSKQLIWQILFGCIQYKPNPHQGESKILNKYYTVENQQMFLQQEIDKQMVLKFYGNIMMNVNGNKRKLQNKNLIIQTLILQIYNQSILNRLDCLLLKNCYTKLLDILLPSHSYKDNLKIEEGMKSEFTIYCCKNCKFLKVYENYIIENYFCEIREKATKQLQIYIQKNSLKFNKQTEKRFQSLKKIPISYIQFYMDILQSQADPFIAIDYYFRLIEFNINLVKLSGTSITVLMSKHFENIAENYRKIILQLNHICQVSTSYDLLILAQQVNEQFQLNPFIKNKMPFAYLALTKVTSKLYRHYGFFNLFWQIQNNLEVYFESFPDNYYYNYAKINFYDSFKCFYQVNENTNKTLYYVHEIDRIKSKSIKQFISLIFLPQQQKKQQIHQPCNNSIYRLKFNFTLIAQTNSENAIKLRQFNHLQNFKDFNFQQVQLRVKQSYSFFTQQIIQQMRQKRWNFPFEKYKYQELKFYLDRLSVCNFQAHKLDLYQQFVLNFQNNFYLMSGEGIEKLHNQLQCYQRKHQNILSQKELNHVKIFEILRNNKFQQIMKMQWSKKDLYYSFISKRAFEHAGVALFYFGQNEQQKSQGRQILLTFVQLFFEKKIGNLKIIGLYFLPYIDALKKEKKAQKTFQILKNTVQSFYYTGSKIIMMNIMYFPNCYTYMLDSLQRQVLLQKIIECQFIKKPQLIEFATIYVHIINKFYGNDYVSMKKYCLQIMKLMPKIAKCSTLKIEPILYSLLWKIFIQQKMDYRIQKHKNTLFKQQDFKAIRKDYFLFRFCQIKIFCTCPWPKFARDISSKYRSVSKSFVQFEQKILMIQYKNKWNYHFKILKLKSKKSRQINLIKTISQKFIEHYMNMDSKKVKKY